METGTKVAIGVGAAVVVGVVGVGVAEHFKHASPANPPPPPPPNPTTQQLTPGHRYSFTLTCPTAIPFPPAFQNPPVPTSAIEALLGNIPGVSVVPGSFTVASGNNGFAVIFDYTGGAMALPAIQVSGATACQTQLVDQGATPVTLHGPPQHGQGGVGGFGVNQGAQTVNVMQGAGSPQVANRAGGLLTINAPGSIASVTGAPVASVVAGANSGQKLVTLSGTAGTIAVAWGTGIPQSATVTVS